MSITIACAPAMLLAPLGTDVDVITLPAVSTGALVNAYDDTVKSLLVSPAPTVYVPVKVVPEAFVNTTVSPVFSVTVIDAPSATASFIVAVILTALPTPKVPFDCVVENEDTVGPVVSTVTLTAAEMAESTPPPVCFEVIDQTPSASVPKLQLVCAVAVKVQVTFTEPDFVAVIVTVLPFVAPLTERVGVLSDVMLSELEEPVSEPASTSGVPGAAGK